MSVPGARGYGFHRAPGNGALQVYVGGTLIGSSTAVALDLPIAATGALASTTTIVAGTGVVVTTGNHTNSAGDHRVTAGNVRLGAVSTFATTEPTSAYIMKEGTNAAGAITTSGGIFVTTGGATVSKIIADGTVSQIEA